MNFDESAMIKALESGDDQAAILALVPLVDGLGWKLFGRTPCEDYKQEAIAQIIETGALRKYDQSKGRAYSYFSKVIQNALTRAWSNDGQNQVAAFGLPATVQSAEPLAEIVKRLTTNAELVAMAEAISHQNAKDSFTGVIEAGRYLASLGYNEAKRRALWAIIREAKVSILEAVYE